MVLGLGVVSKTKVSTHTLEKHKGAAPKIGQPVNLSASRPEIRS